MPGKIGKYEPLKWNFYGILRLSMRISPATMGLMLSRLAGRLSPLGYPIAPVRLFMIVGSYEPGFASFSSPSRNKVTLHVIGLSSPPCLALPYAPTCIRWAALKPRATSSKRLGQFRPCSTRSTNISDGQQQSGTGTPCSRNSYNCITAFLPRGLAVRCQSP